MIHTLCTVKLPITFPGESKNNWTMFVVVRNNGLGQSNILGGPFERLKSRINYDTTPATLDFGYTMDMATKEKISECNTVH